MSYQQTIASELAKNPFCKTSAIHFEISNRCNLAAQHPSCPIGPVFQKEQADAGGKLKYTDYLKQGTYLSVEAVEQCIAELGEFQYSGAINFHRYNDPLIELEKLKRLVAYASACCPESAVIIYTNALPLKPELARDLVELGATDFLVSAYNEKMEQKVEDVFATLPQNCSSSGRQLGTQVLSFKSSNDEDNWGDSALDDRLTLYERAERGEERASPYGPCFAPLNDVTVSHTGEVVLCCLDWKDSVSFGNVYKESLSDILRKEPLIDLYCELSRDIRNLPICRACGWSR